MNGLNHDLGAHKGLDLKKKKRTAPENIETLPLIIIFWVIDKVTSTTSYFKFHFLVHFKIRGNAFTSLEG